MRRQLTIPASGHPACGEAVRLLGGALTEAGLCHVEVSSPGGEPDIAIDVEESSILLEWEERGALEEDHEEEDEEELSDQVQPSLMAHYLPTLLALATNVAAAEAFCSVAERGGAGDRRPGRPIAGRARRPGEEV